MTKQFRFINKTGNPRDTKIMLGDEDVTEAATASGVMIVLKPDSMYAVMTITPDKIDIIVETEGGYFINGHKNKE